MFQNALQPNVNYAPPRCPRHPEEQMVLHFYSRPGGPPGNGWGCMSCIRDRETPPPKTRFPEGSEL
jgi:hypothetical protein